jgi:hypothetical protein
MPSFEFTNVEILGNKKKNQVFFSVIIIIIVLGTISLQRYRFFTGHRVYPL